MFECGRLVIDGRWFNLAIEVPDAAAHASSVKMQREPGRGGM